MKWKKMVETKQYPTGRPIRRALTGEFPGQTRGAYPPDTLASLSSSIFTAVAICAMEQGFLTKPPTPSSIAIFTSRLSENPLTTRAFCPG